MRKPVVHLNGTSAERLLEGFTDARYAVSKAIDALEEAAPNARDYYPLGGSAFDVAVDEHRARVDKLRSVAKELGELAEHVAEVSRG